MNDESAGVVNGEFNVGVPLTVGSKSLVVSETDDVCNTVSAGVQVNFLDKTAPAIAISSPKKGSIVLDNRPRLQLQVSFEDDSGVDADSLHFDDGMPMYVTCTWAENLANCYPEEPLPEGLFTITAHVSDATGNSAWAKTTFIISLLPLE